MKRVHLQWGQASLRPYTRWRWQHRGRPAQPALALALPNVLGSTSRCTGPGCRNFRARLEGWRTHAVCAAKHSLPKIAAQAVTRSPRQEPTNLFFASELSVRRPSARTTAVLTPVGPFPAPTTRYCDTVRLLCVRELCVRVRQDKVVVRAPVLRCVHHGRPVRTAHLERQQGE